MKRKFFQLVESRKELQNAGTKAPKDVTNILCSMGFVPLRVKRYSAIDGILAGSILRRVITRLLWDLSRGLMLVRIPFNSIVVIQYPLDTLVSNGIDLIRLLVRVKKVRLITLMHDLPGHGSRRASEVDKLDDVFYAIAEMSESIIVHNSSMAKWLIDRGCDESKLVEIGVFDYLIEGKVQECSGLDFKKVIIAGNLSLDKAGYLLGLKDLTSVQWELWGGPANSIFRTTANIDYKGSVDSEELPLRLKDGMGLIWDGPTIDECQGVWGEYLTLNNPHKMSLYLACGLPVFIWSKAAQAEFVRKYGVGLVVNSLKEIPELLTGMSHADYQKMAINARDVGMRIRVGDFTRVAVTRAITRIV